MIGVFKTSRCIGGYIMGAFHYDGFLMKMLVKGGNILIVSFFWVISCIPIVTIIPATAALYHTNIKVIRQSGAGVTRAFFSHLRSSLKQGIALSVICLICGLLIYTSLSFSRPLWQNSILWTAYFAFGLLLAFVFLTMLLFIPPTLSRFECSVLATLRLSLYFASRNLLRSIWLLTLFVALAVLVYVYPIALLILPGLYVDFICGGVEKTFHKFMKENGLEEPEEASAKQVSNDPTGIESQEPSSLEASSLELAKLMDDPDETSGPTGENNE